MRLNILENQLDKPVEKQLESISLALQNINSWGGQVRSTLILDFSDDSAMNTSTTSQEWTDIKGLKSTFKPNNSLVQYIVKIYMDTDSEVAIGIFVDDELVDQFVTSSIVKDTHCFNGFFNISAGITHNINIKWRMISAGTANKYILGNNKIQIVAINN